MIKRFVAFCFFVLLIISFILYFAGVREINLFNGSDWLRAISTHFNDLNIRISNIPEWTVTLSSNPSVWEQIAYYLTFIVNFFVGLYNVVISLINFVADIVKLMIALIWVFVESPSILAA